MEIPSPQSPPPAAAAAPAATHPRYAYVEQREPRHQHAATQPRAWFRAATPQTSLKITPSRRGSGGRGREQEARRRKVSCFKVLVLLTISTNYLETLARQAASFIAGDI